MTTLDPTLTEPVRTLLRTLADECFQLAGFDPKLYPKKREDQILDLGKILPVLESLGSYLACMAEDVASSDPATHAQTLTGLVSNLVRDCRLHEDAAKPIVTLVDSMLGRNETSDQEGVAEIAQETIEVLADAGITATWHRLAPECLRVDVPAGPTLVLEVIKGTWSGHLARHNTVYATQVPQTWPEWKSEAIPLASDPEDIARMIISGYRRYEAIADARRKARLALRSLVDAAGVLNEQWDALIAEADHETFLSASYPFAKNFDDVLHELITWRDRHI